MVKEKVRKKKTQPVTVCSFAVFICVFYVTPCDMFLGKLTYTLWEKITFFQGKMGPQFSPFLEFIMHVVFY